MPPGPINSLNKCQVVILGDILACDYRCTADVEGSAAIVGGGKLIAAPVVDEIQAAPYQGLATQTGLSRTSGEILPEHGGRNPGIEYVMTTLQRSQAEVLASR